MRRPTHDHPPPLSLVRQPVLVALAVIVVYGVCRALVEARTYVAVGFFAIVFASFLTYPIDFLARKLPRGVATAITVVAFAGVLVGLGWLVVPVVVAQATQIAHTLPDAMAAAVARLPSGSMAAAAKSAAASRLGALFGKVLPLAFDLSRILTAALLIVIAGFFLAASPASYFRGVRMLVPVRHEAAFDEWWHRTGATLRRWVAGTGAAMLIMGALTAAGLAIIRVHDWFLLALLTFLGTSVPYLGAIASSIPALLVAWAMSPTKLLYVLLLYIVIHHVEGYIVQPFIMRRAVELRPATLLGWLVLMTALFGIAGALVATPALACVKETVSYFYVERRLHKQSRAWQGTGG